MLNTTLILAESIASLGVKAGTDHLRNRYDEAKLKQSLINYVKTRKKFDEICAGIESDKDIDIPDITGYVEYNLLDDVKKRMFCPRKQDRELARESIVAAAVQYAGVDSDEKKESIAKIIYFCLDTIKDYYKSKISLEDNLLATEIIDAINDKSEYSIDIFTHSIQSGNLEDINRKLRKLSAHLSVEHPLFPDYGFGFNDTNLISKPLTDNALKKYPPTFIFRGDFSIGGKPIMDSSLDIANYAYRHQLEVTLNVKEAKKLLGEFEDPDQSEAEGMIGKKLIGKPQAFPPAVPCSIMVGETVYFEYVLIRTHEILDDDTCVFGNHEQTDSHFKFEFNAKLNDITVTQIDEQTGKVLITGGSSFKIAIDDAPHRELLNYIRFTKALTEDKDIHIHLLGTDEDLMSGIVNGISYETGFDSIDQEIDFLERLCDIEEYFGISTTIPDEIMNRDYQTILEISDLIRNDQLTRTWDKLNFTGTVGPELRMRLLDIGENRCEFMFDSSTTVSLFDSEFKLDFKYNIKSARIDHYDTLIKSLESKNDGDSLTIDLIAAEDDTAVISLEASSILL